MLFVVIVLIGLVALEYYLFETSPIPPTSNYELDLQKIRQLASSESDNLPMKVNSLVVAKGEFPRVAMIAGESLTTHPLVFPSYQVVYSDYTIIIDAPHNKELHKFFNGTPYYQNRFSIMQEAMRKARHIVVTHEHFDHIGGISQSPHLAEIQEKVRLTPEQINSFSIENAGFPDGSLDAITPLEYENYHALAPGMVLIKAPGHSLGSQIIYLKLQNGTEFLFLGDVVWHMDNIRMETGRPNMVSDFILNENQEQVANQIRRLSNLLENQNENINFLVSHDEDQLQNYIQKGLIHDGFM